MKDKVWSPVEWLNKNAEIKNDNLSELKKLECALSIISAVALTKRTKDDPVYRAFNVILDGLMSTVCSDEERLLQLKVLTMQQFRAEMFASAYSVPRRKQSESKTRCAYRDAGVMAGHFITTLLEGVDNEQK
ncbi:TPA: hypothetical protein KL806_004615 [Escherichia coli]|uniref:hypothetical protein n=1 Tax=Escherichia coli TaxID=562 RepID=UPI0006A3F094|nr:hypothetical protein [Escherichia coli]EFE6917752.1 hypothetical protein [Escherichia coli]EFM6459295.1 hypothetical protein [Escherichia coli]EHY6175104.1 hypothetical protein [Escherichia coli]EIF5180036.1 hypothetical protein [Escherichia coli]EKP6431942.1 hypothetical protein [Escherichia coli]